MHHVVNECKGALGSWRLDLARQTGPRKLWLTAVAVLLLYEWQVVKWKVAQVSPPHPLMLLYRRTVELKGVVETKKPIYRCLSVF